MKKYKSEMVGFTKDNEIVIFDSRQEYLSEVNKKNHNYTRVFASARDCVKSVNDEDTSYANLTKDIAGLVETYSIEIV